MAVDNDGHCLVVAGPGTGKTSTTVAKIKRLLSVNDNRVVAVTFTRDAAEELRIRVIAELKGSFNRRTCQIGTFHSLAIRLLRGANKLGNVLGPAEQHAFFSRAYASVAHEMQYDEALQLLERGKCSLEGCAEQESHLYRVYDDLLKRNKVEDLYDVLRRCVQLMQDGSIYPFPATHMLVDEFQDTDSVQMAWVMEHVRQGTKVTVVGDDDQCVYGWRRALGYVGMTDFRDRTVAEHITLSSNYRCRSEILQAADMLITKNTERIDKRLHAARGPGGSLSSIRCGDRHVEAARIIDWAKNHATPIQDGYYQWTVQHGKCAVLARSRRRLDIIETALWSERIMFNRPPRDSIWRRTPYIFLLGLLQSIQTGANDGIDHALHWAGISHDDIDTLHRLSDGHLWKILDGHGIDKNAFEPDVVKQIIEFGKLGRGWRKMTRAGNYDMVVRAVSEWFIGHTERKDEEEMLPILAESICKLRGSLVQRCGVITGVPSVKNDDSEVVKKDGVHLMTMHGSKGLEFNHVWIAGTEVTTIPSPKSLDYEEERRLMYVAMTRAKDTLSLSSVVTEDVSPFVVEAGLDPRNS